MDTSRRRKALRISAQMFAQMFKQGARVAFEVESSGLPADARIVEARLDLFDYPDTLALLVESETFGELAEGQLYPDIAPLMRTIVLPEETT